MATFSLLWYALGIPKAGFVWDPKTNLENQAKHGVSFEEAQYAFADPRRVIAEDL
jgi:uncharacterized DUF497 family protein